MANNRYGCIAKEAFYVHFCCRAPCGARGLKFLAANDGIAHRGRAPCGARGLKYSDYRAKKHKATSRSLRSAWIEIASLTVWRNEAVVALLAERVD